MPANRKIKLGLPKGSLQDFTFRLFEKAGFKLTKAERSYFPYIDDEEITPIILRAQEMSRYVEDMSLDCGITGNDWILENGSAVVKVEELVYAKHGLTPVRWVLATPEASKIKSVKDLKGKLIATELVNVTRKFLKEKRVKAKVEFSWGATEVKVGAGLVDAIVELTETGSSLKANNLRIVETVCYSTTQLIASKAAWADSWKRQKIENLALMLKGAINSEGKVGLKLNVAEKDLQKVINLLPALKKPTISHLYDGARKNGWLAVETILNGDEVKRLIPRLKRANAQGIIEYPLNKVIY